MRGDGTCHSAARVIELARAGEAGALSALRWYAHTLGAFAGDLCLAMRATGGVLLAGGVIARLGTLFDGAAFRAGFIDKGRFAPLLEQVPCWRFAEPELALHGLAALLRGAVRAPGLDSQGRRIGYDEHDALGRRRVLTIRVSHFPPPSHGARRYRGSARWLRDAQRTAAITCDVACAGRYGERHSCLAR